MDTGSGNLRSVEKALAQVGGAPLITADPARIRAAERLVVPGQGAFGAFMRALHEHDLDSALREFIASGRPYLGICLGLQILFNASEEQGPVSGLGVLAGRVVKFRPREPLYKVPHMGWNQVKRAAADAGDPVLAGIPDNTYFYFVHSYHANPDDAGSISLICSYDMEFTAAVRKDNIFACQFHPEKSQAAGLLLLRNFLESS